MNRKLKRIFKDRFVTFKTIQYPKDYNDDLVHFGSGGEKKGLKKYFFCIRGLFMSYKTVLMLYVKAIVFYYLSCKWSCFNKWSWFISNKHKRYMYVPGWV